MLFSSTLESGLVTSVVAYYSTVLGLFIMAVMAIAASTLWSRCRNDRAKGRGHDVRDR